MGGSVADPVERGFPHLETVREAITALYRRMSADSVRGFDTSVAPGDVAFADADDLYLGAQRVAGVMVRHLRLPEARVIVSFREMTHAANVELTAGPEYFVELNSRFKRHRHDIGAALAHEVTHVWLHRLGLAFDGTRANEILTDTATTYLGAGWLLLDAFRQDALTSQKLGYLTPEEFGYVLAKRARLFGEDPAIWFTSPQAYEAYERGRKVADRDEEVPPLAAAPWLERRRYVRDRRHGQGGGTDAGPGAAGYSFEPGDGSALRVSFPCPTCRVRVRVPVRGHVRARCGLCGSVWPCDT
ncbi:hypothetical protein ACFW4X_12835 [Streptomyces smyrnaeus]|uniref:SprT-like domain-containing protein n=1 Tax=Streptomyces smyrnaeus TaxID=1387713 RepID=A0ABS3XSP5_9ACTN|nr:hypothetical protein [Streptomyces smyrnaeus]MBO8198096.1 hypothetical protein [Streptomyces smyrnaeus]